MSEQFNATCDICGKPYKICRSCQDIKSFQTWRTVTDTLQHYTIYLALVEYGRTKDKAKARQELSLCDLSEKDKFNKNIKVVLDEIFKENIKEDKIIKTETKKTVSQNKKSTKVEKDANNIE